MPISVLSNCSNEWVLDHVVTTFGPALQNSHLLTQLARNALGGPGDGSRSSTLASLLALLEHLT